MQNQEHGGGWLLLRLTPLTVCAMWTPLACAATTITSTGGLGPLVSLPSTFTVEVEQ